MRFLPLLMVAHVTTTTGHGTLTLPMSYALRYDRTTHASNKTDVPESGTCGTGACEWYSQATTIVGPTTNCDPKTRTMGVHCDSKSPVDYPCTAGAGAPW
jgi:hypothetical protein